MNVKLSGRVEAEIARMATETTRRFGWIRQLVSGRILHAGTGFLVFVQILSTEELVACRTGDSDIVIDVFDVQVVFLGADLVRGRNVFVVTGLLRVRNVFVFAQVSVQRDRNRKTFRTDRAFVRVVYL